MARSRATRRAATRGGVRLACRRAALPGSADPSGGGAMKVLNVLVLSWNYPTPAAPQRGLWVQRMAHAAALRARVTVIVPTPWVPPGLPWEALARFRRVPH